MVYHCTVYHWRELQQISFLSRQTHVYHDKTCLLSWQKYACHDKTFVITKLFCCCSKHNFVATIFCCCDKHTFFTTNMCRDKSMLLMTKPLSRHTCDKSFVVTSILLSWQKTFFMMIWWWLLYSAILRSRADSLRLCVILHEWTAFHSVFFNIHRSGAPAAPAWLMPHEPAAVSVHSVYTIQPCHFMQSHIRKVYACLAVTCHLHFWQDDRDLLHATAVTWGWNRYWNRSQHRKLTLEKKILPPLQQGLKPTTFQSRVQWQRHVCRCLSQQNFCRDKNYSCDSSRQW